MPAPVKQQEMINKLNDIIRKVEILQESIEEQKRGAVATKPAVAHPMFVPESGQLSMPTVTKLDLSAASMGRRRTIY